MQKIEIKIPGKFISVREANNLFDEDYFDKTYEYDLDLSVLNGEEHFFFQSENMINLIKKEYQRAFPDAIVSIGPLKIGVTTLKKETSNLVP